MTAFLNKTCVEKKLMDFNSLGDKSYISWN